MANDKPWRLDLPSKSSRGSSRSASRRHREETNNRYSADHDERRDDDWKRADDDWKRADDDWKRADDERRSRPDRSDRSRDEESRRSRPRQEDRHRSEGSDRPPDEESRRSGPRHSKRHGERQDDRSRDVDNDWKRAEKTWTPPLERSDRNRDEHDGSRRRSGDSGKLPPQYDDYEPYDEPPRTSSPSRRRSQYEPYEEPEKTRPSLWGDESEEQPALSPLWAGDPVATRGWTQGWTRWNLSAVRGEGSKRKRWWRLPNFKDRGDRRRSLLWSAAAGLLIVLCVLPSLTFVGVFATYKHASTLATDGIAQLQQGGTLLADLQKGQIEASVTTAALQHFQRAYSDFTQLQAALGLIPGFAGGLPKYGGEIASGQQLVPIAVEASHLAVLGTSALNLLLERISNPFSKTGSGLSTGDIGTIDSDFHQVVALFTTLAGQIKKLSPASLTFNAKLGADIVKVKAELPKAQPYIQLADNVIMLLPALLGVGTSTHYLVEVLDSTEVRPGGGFLGNIGVLTLTGGRLDGLKVTDVDLLDRKYVPGIPDGAPTAFIPIPQQYQWFATAETQTSWSLRDSNLEADFPTDAIYAEQNYQQEAEALYQANPAQVPPPVQFQGVMAITPALIEGILGITGPITMPAPYNKAPAPYNQPVSASNMVNLIHYYQLGKGHKSDVVPAPGSSTSQRKLFTYDLFKQLMAKVASLANTKQAEFVKLALSSLQTKDLQLYLGNISQNPSQPSPGEALLQKFHVASTIEAPPTGDSLFIVDTNVAGNKQNEWINTKATDDISIDPYGNVTHTVALTYNWPTATGSTADNFGPDPFQYVDHIRIYVPPRAQLGAQYASQLWTWVYDWADSGPASGFSTPIDREVFSGDLTFNYGDQVSVYLTWTVPGAAVKSGQTWKYQLLFQRQAGIVWTQNTQITLPPCAKVTSLSKSLTKLKAGPNTTYTVTKPLMTDTTYAVEYTCGA